MAHKYMRAVLTIAVIVLILLGLVLGGVIPVPWAGGFSGGIRELSDAERSQLTVAVEATLQSSQRARFIWYPLREKAAGVYCALINTSNVVGDHTEDRLFEVAFLATPEAGIKSVTSVYMPSDDPSWARIIRGNCAKAGYVAAAPISGGPVTP